MQSQHQETSYLNNLNAPQKEAVETTEGPLLILAGAGTGKTRVLITRLAHILMQHKAWPSEVLAVTFTNKAANEMKTRVSDIIHQDIRGMWLGTFHSISLRILRRHADLVGLDSNFTIIDTDDQIRVIKQLLELENIESNKQTAKYHAYDINTWKDKGLLPDQISSGDLSTESRQQAQHIYNLYQERLKVLNAADFGDLLLHVITIFRNHPNILEQYQRQFKYIMVDEYQDTNVAQYLWLRLLSQKSKNICVVGDDDQSIYGWRGAEIGNILRFEKDFSGAKVIRLEQNYRSTPHILGAASGLISQNANRLGKTLWTEFDEGEPVRIKGTWDAAEEARWIGEEIENYYRNEKRYADMAILVRAGYQTREFEEAFISQSIPYIIIGGVRFYERMEIRDALAYLRLVVQPKDDLAFDRIINVPKRGVGASTVKKLHVIAKDTGLSMMETVRDIVQTDEIRGKTRTALLDFIHDIDRWRGLLDSTNHVDLVEMILDESGYANMWKKDKSIEASGRLENLKELVAAIAEFQDLPAFLEHVSLVMENTQAAQDDNVTIMTMHSAKGLEYDTVFLSGWEEGVFPSQKVIMEGGKSELEEERRLAYVGLTRARKRAYITFAANRQVHGQWQNSTPSRFLQELPKEHICFLDTSFTNAKPVYTTYQKQNAEKLIVNSNTSKYKVGQRVFHIKFGYGIIAETDNNKLTINFDHTGTKKVMDSFVNPA
jgi:DNA helicase-2/ATP-dependent DNA helicase PcrA